MTSWNTTTRATLTLCATLIAASARAECVFVNGSTWVESHDRATIIFSGTLTVTESAGPGGYHATFEVDRVWKGDVPKRFDLYGSWRAPEIKRFEVGHRYLVPVERLAVPWQRREVGLDNDDAAVFTQVTCGAYDYDQAVRLGIIQALGGGRPPR